MKYISLFVFGVILTGCTNNHKNENYDDEKEVKLKYTAYTDGFELYAEADPFVIGQSSNILSHFSNLPDFSPVHKGIITLRLVVNGQIAEQTLERPLSAGIYSFDIKPSTLGEGNLEYTISYEKYKFKMVIPGIKVFSSADEAVKEAKRLEISNVNTTVFTKEQSWKTDFSTDYPILESTGHVIKTTAQVQPSRNSEIVITARVNGIVSDAGNAILEGSIVKEGQILFSILGGGFADNNSYVRFMEAKNNYEKANADYNRAMLLVQEKIVSDKELLQVKNDYENAKSLYENMSQNFSPNGQTVKSPMAGFIRQFFVKNGQYVETGQPLVIVSQDKTLILHTEVQQKYSPYLSSIGTANIRIPEVDKAFSFEELNGKIVSVGKATAEDNFLIPINIQVNNAGYLMPGSFVELYLKTVSNSHALTLPNTAILEEQGIFFVYVQVTPELFEKREITIGATDGLRTEIIQGISVKERIVTKSAILIKLAQATGTLDAHSGHVH